MVDEDLLDSLFREAVSAIDAGDVRRLETLLEAQSRLVRERLDSPGAWLCDSIGTALDGFFRDPYLLWFVAEDPVRNGKLPGNIAEIAQTIIDKARREKVEALQEQLDYALRLVAWSWIARDCGVQIALIDTLIDAGATPDGRNVYQGRYGTHSDSAIYNKNLAAAEHLLKRGAQPTLSTALCLNRWEDAERLAQVASLEEKQGAFVQAALNGNAEALKRMLDLGMNPTTFSAQNQSHGSALHHAVWSGSLEAVKVLVEAGADLTQRDTIYNGTPLDWAMHGEQQEESKETEDYQLISAYLREKAEKISTER